MVTIALVEQSDESRSRYLESRQLPLCYMEDFSLVGLEVSDYLKTSDFLEESGFTVTACPGGGDVALHHINDLPDMIRMLHQQGIEANMRDVADTIYQA